MKTYNQEDILIQWKMMGSLKSGSSIILTLLLELYESKFSYIHFQIKQTKLKTK